MSFRSVSKNKEDLKQGGGGYLTGSGFYPVTLLAPFVSVSRGGSSSVDFYLEHQGQKQVLYGNLRITNNDGSDNEIGSRIFNQLMVITGHDDIADPVEDELPIGKGQAMKPAAILQDLCDVDVVLRVQMEYGAYNGNITEKKVVKSFFRASDNASAEEVVNETEPGLTYEKEQKYADNITYKDGVTPEAVTAWIAAGRPEGTAGDTGGAAEQPKFGEKRSFGKK